MRADIRTLSKRKTWMGFLLFTRQRTMRRGALIRESWITRSKCGVTELTQTSAKTNNKLPQQTLAAAMRSRKRIRERPLGRNKLQGSQVGRLCKQEAVLFLLEAIRKQKRKAEFLQILLKLLQMEKVIRQRVTSTQI